jgi:hypothetical protein
MVTRFIKNDGSMGSLRRTYPLLSRILLLMGSLAASLVAGEAALRICLPSVRQPFLVRESIESERGKFCMYDPLLGWTGKPYADDYFSYIDCRHHVRQNKYGFRGTEYGYARTATDRIVVLGDSFVWGFGVGDAEIFTSVMERESHPPVEMVNLGVSGYGTDQEYLLWRSLGARFRPDEVILTIEPYTDIWENVSDVAYGYPKPIFDFTEQGGYQVFNQPVPLSGAAAWRTGSTRVDTAVSEMRERHILAAHSTLVSAAITALARQDGLRRWMESRHILPVRDHQLSWLPLIHMDPPVVDTPLCWEHLFRLIGLIHADVLKNGARFRILIVPSVIQVYPDLWFTRMNQLPPGESWDRDAPNRRIMKYCRENGIPVTDPLPALRAAARTDLFLYFPWNSHWTAASHRLVARQLLRDIATSPSPSVSRPGL